MTPSKTIINVPSVNVDYPQGDGDPACQECHGRGVVDVLPRSKFGGIPPSPETKVYMRGPPAVQLCGCVKVRDLRDHINHRYPPVMTVKAKTCEFIELRDSNAWLTFEENEFLAQFKTLAGNRGTAWDWSIQSDKSLMESWLATAEEVRDDEVREAKLERVTPLESLRLLVESPALLIILTGIKRLRNSAMPEAIQEAIRVRQQKGLPTWIVDTPDAPFTEDGYNQKLNLGWSKTAEKVISKWERVIGEWKPTAPRQEPRSAVASPYQTQAVSDFGKEPEPKKKWGR